MLQLNNLTAITKKRKRVGRGGSRGGQAGRGHKGQKARSGGKVELKAFFEGGQMPLSRRLPRRGFTNIFKKEYKLINIKQLEERFNDGDSVNVAALKEKGLLKGKQEPMIKLLGVGTLTKKLTITVDAYSKTAQQAVEKANGTIQLTKEISRGSVTAQS